MTIAIDGPSAAGKSTAAKLLAQKLNMHYLDTGALFRALALQVLRAGVAPGDEQAVMDVLQQTRLDIRIEDGRQATLLDGEDVSNDIRSAEVSQGAAAVGQIAGVRDVLTQRVREMAAKYSLIVDGRDIGTAMLPDADYKFFLVADAEQRAQRRYDEMLQRGEKADYQQVLSDIIQRDKLDTTRAIAPLVKASDAIEIDSTHLDAEGVVQMMVKEIC